MFTNKVLCLGNNDQDTDERTSVLAKQNSTTNHGLITDSSFVPKENGYYHTTILDIPAGQILKLSQHFDSIVMFDQPAEQWSHWKPLLSTYKIMLELDKQGKHTVYQDNENIKKYEFFQKFLEENKSFCIYPWINWVEHNGELKLCKRSSYQVTTVQELKDWRTNSNYQEIRKKMLAGERMPDKCSTCYDYEDKGIESYRIFETKDWINQLEINSIEDLEKISSPKYYEISPSNKCNIMCRGCVPENSHLIDKEFREHQIKISTPWQFKFSSTDFIDVDSLDSRTRVYLAGGEPTIMPETLAWLRKCIAAGKTDFDLTFGTNGVKFSKTFLDLVNQFSNVNFSVSMDGYGRVNDYWRWGSDWDTIVKNSRLVKELGHNLSINTVPGIYNVTNMHLLFEFLDREFPETTVYLQINYFNSQSCYNHPNAELVVESMERCKQTSMYYSDGKSNKTCIDSLYDYYSNNPVCDLESLREFFEFNDRLDQARGSRLGDYIPELEDCRRYLR